MPDCDCPECRGVEREEGPGVLSSVFVWIVFLALVAMWAIYG